MKRIDYAKDGYLCSDILRMSKFLDRKIKDSQSLPSEVHDLKELRDRLDESILEEIKGLVRD
jgi:hypothetical protein